MFYLNMVEIFFSVEFSLKHQNDSNVYFYLLNFKHSHFEHHLYKNGLFKQRQTQPCGPFSRICEHAMASFHVFLIRRK